MAKLDKRVGFVGSGQMAEALARGLLAKNVITGDMIVCSDPNPSRTELFSSFGATPYESNVDVSGHGYVHAWTYACMNTCMDLCRRVLCCPAFRGCTLPQRIPMRLSLLDHRHDRHKLQCQARFGMSLGLASPTIVIGPRHSRHMQCNTACVLHPTPHNRWPRTVTSCS